MLRSKIGHDSVITGLHLGIGVFFGFMAFREFRGAPAPTDANPDSRVIWQWTGLETRPPILPVSPVLSASESFPGRILRSFGPGLLEASGLSSQKSTRRGRIHQTVTLWPRFRRKGWRGRTRSSSGSNDGLPVPVTRLFLSSSSWWGRRPSLVRS